MSSSMVYCQYNFWGTPPRANTVNSFDAPLQSTVSLAPLYTNGCTSISTKALTKTSLASETGNITEKAERFKEQEHLLFGIDRILYGSSKTGKNFDFALFQNEQRATYAKRNHRLIINIILQADNPMKRRPCMRASHGYLDLPSSHVFARFTDFPTPINRYTLGN